VRLDLFATEPQFADHLAAVWHALPATLRGDFIVPSRMRDRASARGIEGGPTMHDESRPVLVASYGDNVRMRRMGRKRIAYIEHGAGQAYPGDRKNPDHPTYAGGKNRDDVGLFMMPNEYSAALWRAAYPEAQVEVIGCPKLDTLPALEADTGTVCISFHWYAEHAIQETRGTFGYYREILPELAQRFRLIGHGHPRALDAGLPRLRREYARLGIELVEDFEDVCRRASLYVFDNSSSGFEFAATGRPVVVMNEPEGRYPGRGYRTKVNHGLRFWDAAAVGINVWHSAQLVDAIERAMIDPPEVRRAREAALDIVYAYRSGAPQRAALALAAWMDERVEVAA